VVALNTSWDILKQEDQTQGENKRPEHKTPEMHMNEHEDKFRSALGDMQAIQANDPLKRLISSSLGPITAAREKIRELLDRAGVAHQAPGAKKITGKLDKVADAADEAYRHLLAHTNESEGGGFDRNALDTGVPTNTTGQGGPLEYAMADMKNNSSAPENPF
jgi:hypothetical protein